MVILFDQYNLPENIYEIIFATNQQVVVAKLLIDEIKKNGGEIGKTEMSMFATALHEGKLVEVEQGMIKKKVNFSYNKRQFYDRILTPMKSMGLIYYDLYKNNYAVTDQFYKDMLRIGLMWKKELERKV